MKTIQINGKNLLSYNKKEIIKQIKDYSNQKYLDKDMIIAYDDISNVYFLFTIVGWNYYKSMNFIYHIKTINCKNYNKLTLNKIEELIFNKE